MTQPIKKLCYYSLQKIIEEAQVEEIWNICLQMLDKHPGVIFNIIETANTTSAPNETRRYGEHPGGDLGDDGN